MTAHTGPYVVTDTVGTDGTVRIEHRDDLVDAIRGWFVQPGDVKPAHAASEGERQVLERLDQLESALPRGDHQTVRAAAEFLGIRIDPTD